MSATAKFLIGLVAVLLMGWAYHGPFGNGAALVERLEGEARAAVAASEVGGVEVRLGRDPLTRTAILSGPANDYQRQGMGEFPGLNDRVGGIEGIAGVRWTDDPAAGERSMPLLLETLILVLLAYLLGVALGWLLFGRAKKDGYL